MMITNSYLIFKNPHSYDICHMHIQIEMSIICHTEKHRYWNKREAIVIIGSIGQWDKAFQLVMSNTVK